MKGLSFSIAAIAAVAMVAAPSALGTNDTPSPNQVAAKMCQAEKHADPAAFETTYGAKHTMRECKRAHRGEATEVVRNASQECRAERDADEALFQTTYGTNGNGNGNGAGKNAFGKCVSTKVQEELA